MSTNDSLFWRIYDFITCRRRSAKPEEKNAETSSPPLEYENEAESPPQEAAAEEEKTPPEAKNLPAVHTAIYPYTSQSVNDLSFEKGDLFDVLNDSVMQSWSLVRHRKDGSEGFAPSNYLAPFETFENQPWYFGRLTSAEVINHLSKSPEGAFLVRQSENGQPHFSYCLSVRCSGDRIKHFRIHQIVQEDGRRQFYLFAGSDHPKFDSIEELIRYYTSEPPEGSDRLKLGFPCTATNLPATGNVTYIETLKCYEIDRSSLQLIELIGTGRFSEVWRAKLGRTVVAVKVIEKGGLNVEAFTREAEIMTKLWHPNLMRLKAVSLTPESGPSDQPYYLVMEWMPQGDLLTFLKTQTVSTGQKLEISYQIARGMEYLESENYVHRHLAARNVLIGRKLEVKIADFGLQRVLNRSIRPDIRWAAPEVYYRAEYTCQSDVWSFGVVLYEIFSGGCRPYNHLDTNEKIIQYLLEGQRLAKPDNCPEGVQLIMGQCWTWSSASRPTFAHLNHELSRLK